MHVTQLESLMNYAASKKANPFYLLYNFSPAPSASTLSGCTLIAAEYLFKHHYNKKERTWLVPDYEDLHPSPAFDWHEIACPDKAIDLYRKFKDKGLTEEGDDQFLHPKMSYHNLSEPGFFPINTFKKDDGWEDIRNLYVTGKGVESRYTRYTRKSAYLEEVEETKTHHKFSPKSRLILSK